MATRSKSIPISYKAWNSSSNSGQTGDVGNHTLRIYRDGLSSIPNNSPTEVDSVNAPGQYQLILSDYEMSAAIIQLFGKSNTPNVSIIPVRITTGT